MSNRFWFLWSTLVIALTSTLFAPTFLRAQSSSSGSVATKTASKTDVKATANAKAKAWVMPRTPDGHPDLHGYYNFLSFTPMERPAKYGNREFLTDKEMEAAFKTGVQTAFEPRDGDEQHYGNELFNPNSVDYDPTTYGLSPWQNGIKPNPRTSLVVDPPDGRIPPLTPEGKAARAARTLVQGHDYVVDDNQGGGVVHADVPLDLGLGTTCVTPGGGPPILPGEYNADLYILQSPESVVIQGVNGFRIIPLDGRAHASPNIHQWHGDGVGHWEGDTLVVETTNFRPEDTFRGANPKTLKITERFTLIAADQIEYKFTVNDPSTWTKPWSGIIPFSAEKGPLFEFACSEDDFDAVNILAGARAVERKAASEKTGSPISQK
jgi:hypothetical protein